MCLCFIVLDKKRLNNRHKLLFFILKRINKLLFVIRVKDKIKSSYLKV